MPGLVGIISKSRGEDLRQDLYRMLASMYRQNSLGSGTFISADPGVYAGWTCHQGSYADCMPINNDRGDITLLFGGEHYAQSDGIEARTAKDAGCPVDKASVLLPIYESVGEELLPLLNGFFHGLIIDKRNEKTILFNDRFGMQRLYYYESPNAFYFASEAKSILAVRQELRSFDLQSLGEWMSCGAVLENRCLYKDLRVLPGASAWTWRPDGSQSRRSYFSCSSWENQDKLSLQEFSGELRSRFPNILTRYLRGYQKIGLSATGGLDTRMILAHLKESAGAIHCYSFDGPYRECLDVKIGRKVARAAGYPHTTIKIGDDFFRRFPRLAEDVVLSTDGNLELSGAPNLYMNEACRQLAAVRLTGNYGSEILRRHRAFAPSDEVCRLVNPDLAVSVRRAATTWAATQECDRLTFVAFKQVPWYSYNRLQAEQSLISMRSPFMDNKLLELVYRAPEESTASNEISLWLIIHGNPRLGRIMTDRGVSYPRTAVWPLARAYYEFLFKMEYYAGHGMPRRIAAIDKHLGPLSLEKVFLGRNKYYHLRQWFRDELSQYVKETLLDGAKWGSEYLDRKAVISAINSHIGGDENHTHSISKLLALELSSRLILKTQSYDPY